MHLSLRARFGLLALAGIGLTAAGLVIGDWMKLQPCPLCIFQRLLYLLIALLALAGGLLPGWRRLWAALIGLTAAGGVATAAYQSWLQYYPDASRECGFGEPTPVSYTHLDVYKRQAVLRADCTADFETVLAGQHDVENHQVGSVGEDARFGSVATRLDKDFEIVLAQVFGSQVGEAFIVLDEQDSCLHGPMITGCCRAINPGRHEGPERALGSQRCCQPPSTCLLYTSRCV